MKKVLVILLWSFFLSGVSGILCFMLSGHIFAPFFSEELFIRFNFEAAPNSDPQTEKYMVLYMNFYGWLAIITGFILYKTNKFTELFQRHEKLAKRFDFTSGSIYHLIVAAFGIFSAFTLTKYLLFGKPTSPSTFNTPAPIKKLLGSDMQFYFEVFILLCIVFAGIVSALQLVTSYREHQNRSKNDSNDKD